MRLREVNFEGHTVKMPFLSVEYCYGHHALFAEKLRGLEGDNSWGSICGAVLNNLSEDDPDRRQLGLMLHRTFGNMRTESGQRYNFLGSFVMAQMQHGKPMLDTVDGLVLSERIRKFWIAKQLEILE